MMKRLSQLLAGLEYKAAGADLETGINNITDDSRKAGTGSLFVAVSGTRSDGHTFIDEAVKNGASAVVVDEAKAGGLKKGAPIIKVKDTKDALRVVANNFYDWPSKKVKAIGITGTNGKTTVSYLAQHILARAGHKAGVIGTIKYSTGKNDAQAGNTTPGMLELTRLFSEMASSGMHYAVMEVSSHSLDQGRVRGIEFERACFTNLTQDHLDYHKDFEGYFNAKARLFKELGEDKAAIVNVDCPFGRRLVSLTKARVYRCSLNEKQDAWIKDLKLGPDGMDFKLCFGDDALKARSPMIGRHNAYNILIASACCRSLGVGNADILKAISEFNGAPGRLELIKSDNGLKVFVDYAHTDDAITNVLKSLREVAKAKLIIVFGCGGDRDRTKRPKMGRAATELADYAILTSDNPRSEDPEAVLADIEKGINKDNYEKIADRRKAIARALSLAKKDDIVLIAGKGHETCQIFKDRTEAFDDRQVAREILSSHV